MLWAGGSRFNGSIQAVLLGLRQVWGFEIWGCQHGEIASPEFGCIWQVPLCMDTIETIIWPY